MPEVGQRSLANLKIRFSDGELDAKYAVPFWDREWRVRFVMLDLVGGRDVLIPAPVAAASMHEIRVDRRRDAATPLTAEEPERFAGFHHFDTAWVLRGSAGIPEGLRHAVMRTNLAGKAKAGSEKVHDIEFDEHLDRVLWVVTKDRTFVTRRYTRERLTMEDLR